MKIQSKNMRRAAYAGLALAVLLSSVLSLYTGTASAAQVSTRSIKMSDSTLSKTGVSYLFTFTPIAATAKSMVIDFCSNSSIISGSCTAPTGFSASGATFTVGTNTTGYSLGTGSASMVKVTGTVAIPASTTTFTIGNITNPSSNGSLYARIYTYSDSTYGSTGTAYTSPTAIGSNVDYGGFALSIANQVTVSATVMETLLFCVSKLAPGPSCGTTGQAVTTPTIVLGHGSPATLDGTAVDTDTAYTQISTNANAGVSVSLNNESSTVCAGLSRDSGATCGIPGKGTFGTVAAGTAFFGLNVANGTGGTGTVTANANYGTTAASYGMGTATYGTYGDPVESATAPCASVNSLLTYAATAAVTTPAGVYTANHSFVATGVF